MLGATQTCVHLIQDNTKYACWHGLECKNEVELKVRDKFINFKSTINIESKVQG